MITLPEVTVVGTLTGDPELRFTQSGTAVANINIACNTRKKDQQTGEWVDGDTTFLRGTIWKEYAENVAETLEKGQKVIARGVLKQRNFEKDGQKRSVMEMEVEEIGPTLRFATAKVNRAQRNGGGRGSNNFGGNSGGAWGNDPWGDDEPPF